MWFRSYLIAAILATGLYSYGQYKGKPLFGTANETRERAGVGGGRLYHK